MSKDWANVSDPGTKIMKMKNGRTRTSRTRKSTPSTWTEYRSPRKALFPEVESVATRMKGLALCGEDLFYSFFGYELQ
jgi:hypothetical protein